jgi:signal transduction histidine kinase
MVAAALFLGINLRNRRAYLASLRERAARLERERDQQATIATAAERTRIAREMHDIVAHSLSVMVTLADGASVKVAGDPTRAAGAMRQVSATGRQALGDMRRLLGVLRTDEGDSTREPQPGVAQIDGLIEQVRATGLVAELTLAGAPIALTPGAEVAVYRIIQEALTNTLKHAVAPTRVQIGLRYRPDVVEVDVCDDGGSADVGERGPVAVGAASGGVGGVGSSLGRSAPRTEGAARKAGAAAAMAGTATGHGLVGMRERAAVYGGSVLAGPAPGGGWRVTAELPVEAVASSVPSSGGGLVAP